MLEDDELLGEAIAIDTQVGWAVGLTTAQRKTGGRVVWIASPTFASRPGLEEVALIESWRWPIVLAVRKKEIDVIGRLRVPSNLDRLPVMRGMDGRGRWVEGRFADGDTGRTRVVGPTDDRSLPIYMVVNISQLIDMITSGWRPEDRW